MPPVMPQKGGFNPQISDPGVEFKPNRDNFKKSLLVKEFGTPNKHGHLNCFLNVNLQTLW